MRSALHTGSDRNINWYSEHVQVVQLCVQDTRSLFLLFLHFLYSIKSDSG
jgi:hypothetical protein